ncbi:hypothetical protein EK0264_00585 [Epidermidibacterium keratini]|uniref:Uncharacterized protein n=1 Tax=Epidermidibacterium keratini TaxID=1891644 RepID=A0A7L4YJD1_9ACTN|nr:hypothetical protein [Epidermidibacterium keratini]QHB98938.1 hypothetical protein EK0264_00585 [Epidermidibacterium keratini]
MTDQTFGEGPDDTPTSAPADADSHAGRSAHIDIPERFAEDLQQLEGIEQRPVAEHPQIFDDVHQRLRRQLDDAGS